MNLTTIKAKGKLATLVIHYKGGCFDCAHNYLTSLEGAPSSVSDSFSCSYNKLTSLIGAPSSVGGDFHCSNNKLTSLVGAPTSVVGAFGCACNKLTKLIGAPSSVGGDFYCVHNQLTSLVGAPSSVDGDFSCFNNKLISLKDIHKQIKESNGELRAYANPIKSHVLGLLLIKGIIGVVLDNKEVQDILNRHLPSRGMRDVLEAQDELIDAGLEEFAQL